MTTTYRIRDTEWPSKTAIKAHVRSVLNTHKPGSYITDPQFLSICAHLFPGTSEVWAGSEWHLWGVGRGYRPQGVDSLGTPC